MKKIIFLILSYYSAHLWAACTAGYSNPYLIESTPSFRFSTLSNQTIKDNQTGLIWDRCPLGQIWNGSTCTGNPLLLTWQGALRQAIIANNNNYLGYSDWRVANIKELASIIETCGYDPAINNFLFPLNIFNPDGSLADLIFWSSTSSIREARQAWVVEYRKGTLSQSYKNDTDLHYVRLVRGGNDFDWLNPVISDVLDADGDGQKTAFRDGLIILRYFAQYQDLISGAYDTQNCTRCNNNTVGAYLDSMQSNGSLDIDGNNQSNINDGLMIYRYLAGIRGNALIQGVIGINCTRCTPEAIANYLDDL